MAGAVMALVWVVAWAVEEVSDFLIELFIYMIYITFLKKFILRQVS